MAQPLCQLISVSILQSARQPWRGCRTPSRTTAVYQRTASRQTHDDYGVVVRSGLPDVPVNVAGIDSEMTKPKAVMSFLHTQIWQRLPRGLRRSALFAATARAAPKPSPDARPAHPVIVVGALRTASGLGQSARLCYDALDQAGIPVMGIDVTRLLGEVEDMPDYPFRDGSACVGAGTLIVHVNAPTFPLAMFSLGQKLIEHKYVVGCWAWELPDAPPDWKHGVPFVHEIWTPSAFTAASIAPIAGNRPVPVVPYSIALGQHPKPRAPRQAGTPFTVVTIFNVASSFARKNPCAAIQAFRLAFGDAADAHLIVKIANTQAFPKSRALIEKAAGNAPNITIIDRTFNALEIALLYAQADALISLHRSEGFGLTIAEAMLYGIPTVATGWSGNVDFLTPQTGISVPYTLIPATDPQGGYQYPGMNWAQPDIPAAAAGLRYLYEHPVEATRLGESAARFAHAAWSPALYVETVRRQLGL